MNEPIYLDNNATTKVDPRVVDAIVKEFEIGPSNPSSMHKLGLSACDRLEESREVMAKYLKVKNKEILFTSGGTEAINMAIRGIMGINPKGHIITSSVEHSAVLNTVQALTLLGCDATIIDPGLKGHVSPEEIEQALRSDTKLIVLMSVNNETGIKTDISAIAKIAKKHGIPFIVDSIALLGKEPFDIPDGVSAMCFSGHKCHAPQGVGMLYLQSDFEITPLLTGGGQEFGKRSGTQNLSGIIGFAEAVNILEKELAKSSPKMKILRDRLEEGLKSIFPQAIVIGTGPRVVNTTCLAFPGIEREVFFNQLNAVNISVSSGSACFSSVVQPSRVLLNMDIPEEIAKTALRFSVSRMTTEEEIEKALRLIGDIL